MKNRKDISIQKKLFACMLLISTAVTGIITGAAVLNTYETMKEQLIYNRRMSAGWLRDRLELSVYQGQFYEFEVSPDLKASLQNWCIGGRDLTYEARSGLITAMNEAVSMDGNLNGMEIYNLSRDEVLIAHRSGASLEPTGDRLDRWNDREKKLQSNLVFMRTEKEILVAHQMHRFTDREPYAVIVMHVRPYALKDMLSDIKMTEDETVLILNDEDRLIEGDFGELEGIEQESIHLLSANVPPADGHSAVGFPEGILQAESLSIQSVARQLALSEKKEFLLDGNFWFLREAGGGKLKILLSVPDHAIMDSLKATVRVAVLIGLAMIAASVAGAGLFARAFSRPIIELAERMRHFTLSDREEGRERRPAEETVSTGNEVAILRDSFGIMVDRNRRLVAQEYQMELEKREAQVHALQAQINPHFMYNVMQVIGGMALEKNAPEIYRVTTALGDLMRYCLNFSREMVSLREEIQYLKSYCMLQNERFNGRIELKTDIDEALMKQSVPRLILQPVLENSFQHGLVNRPGSWIISVTGELETAKEGARTLILTVTDNGGGMSRERLAHIRENLKKDAQTALNSSAHIGLCNVDARIRLKYPGENFGISIDSRQGEGTTVTIRMEAAMI